MVSFRQGCVKNFVQAGRIGYQFGEGVYWTPETGQFVKFKLTDLDGNGGLSSKNWPMKILHKKVDSTFVDQSAV